MAEEFSENLDKILSKLTLLSAKMEQQNSAIAELKQEQQRQTEELRTLSGTSFINKVFQCSTPTEAAAADHTVVVAKDPPTVQKDQSEDSRKCAYPQPLNPSNNSCMFFPPPFDSHVTRWRDYQVQFDIAAEANGWNSKEKAQVLATLLRGESVAVLNILDSADRADYDKLTSALQLRFLSQEKHISHSTFRSRQQRLKEDIGAYASDIRRLTRIVFEDCPAEAQERIAIMQFVDGIYDRSIQENVRLADPKTFNEAVSRAITVEAAHFATQTIHQARSLELSNEENPRYLHNNQLRRPRANQAASGPTENYQQSATRGQR